MSASRKTQNKILGLITPSRAEDLLVSWADLTSASAKRMRSLYPDVVGLLTDSDLLEKRDELRLVWDTQDRRHREWWLFQFRRSYQHDVVIRDLYDKNEAPNPHRTNARLEAVPALTPLEAALYYFQTRLGELAKHCGNPTCPHPYFIATKKWQKYCSESCAVPAMKESKRTWWRENRGKKGDFE